MNIEKLAKHLKEFTLDEIEMIAECDCIIELERLLNSNKIVFEQGLYKYKEKHVSRKGACACFSLIIGFFVDGCREGQGAIVYNNKCCVYGQWLKDKRNGLITYVRSWNGMTEQNMYKNGEEVQ